MVLHLLGKKSWNVYNTDNIERVRRDEAQAAARLEAEEARMQEEDAARRISILRGEVPALPVVESAERSLSPRIEDPSSRSDWSGRPHEKKRKRLRGEDDTDRDIRYARENIEAGHKASVTLRKQDDAPLIDQAGHVQLIPTPHEHRKRQAENLAKADGRETKKPRKDEDYPSMRFSDAAGYGKGMDRPWYASNKQAMSDRGEQGATLVDVLEKDVWGNEDPLRKEREQSRISASDPFAAMQQAQQQLKKSERDRSAWQKARLAELHRPESESKPRSGEAAHRRGLDDEESLDGFSLDASREQREKHHHRHSERRKHSHRHHRSRDRSRDRHRSDRPR